MRILLIAGHGAGDSGAPGCGYKEADLTRELVNLIAPELSKFANVAIYDQGRNAFYDVQNGSFNPGNVNYVFEVHFNAFNGAGHGTECFVTTAETGITVEQTIMQYMGKYFTLRDNDSVFDGVKRTNFLVIRTCKNKYGISGALLETCFIDNASDMDTYQKHKAEIAKGIAQKMAEGFGLKSKEPATPPKNWVNVTLQDSVGADNQRWKIEAVGNYYRLINKGTGYALDLANAKTTNNSNIQACTANGTDAQLWKITDTRKGFADYKKISPKLAPDKFLSIEKNGIGGNNVKIWQDLNNSKQEFYLRKETDGYYIILHTFTTKAVTAQD